jgi:hypothetical protein
VLYHIPSGTSGIVLQYELAVRFQSVDSLRGSPPQISGYAQQRHKTNSRTQKRKNQNLTPRSFPSLQNIPLYFEAIGTRGRRLRLAGVSICNHTAAKEVRNKKTRRLIYLIHLTSFSQCSYVDKISQTMHDQNETRNII